MSTDKRNETHCNHMPDIREVPKAPTIKLIKVEEIERKRPVGLTPQETTPKKQESNTSKP
jgi:hypothetical protein